MKRLPLMLALCIPMLASAMKIATDEIDEFTGKRTVITSWESLDKNYIHIRFRYQNDKQFLDFKYISETPMVIGQSASLFFKATDGEINKFESIATFSGGVGEGAVNLIGASKWGISATYTGDISWFSNHCARLLRYYTTDGYSDKKISESDGIKLGKLAVLFNSALGISGDDSANLKVVTCTLTYMKKKKNKQEWEVVDTEYLKEVLSDTVQEKISHWKAQSDDNNDYEVKVTKER